MSRYVIQNLFGIQGLNIAWYGVIVSAGILAGSLLAYFRAKRGGLAPDVLFDFLLLVLPISICCARAYYVIFQWDNYCFQPEEIFKIWHGGLAVYGGILGAITTAVIFCRCKKISFFQFADICVPGLVLGQAIGRWGNFVNQEAFGQIVTEPDLQFFPYAVYIDSLGEWRQAAFFYESMWNLTLLCVLVVLCSRIRIRGISLPVYLMGYGCGRLWIEGLRADSLYLFPGVRVSQAVSVILIICGICLMCFLVKKQRKGG